MRRRSLKYRPEALPDVVRLWLFRILIDLGAHQNFIQRGGLSDDTLAEAIGLAHWTDDEAEKFDRFEALADLRRLAKSAQSSRRKPALPKTLASNARRLAQLVGLSRCEQQILGFAVLLHNSRVLREAADLLGQVSLGALRSVLSVVLELPEDDIGKALGSEGVLARSGLLTVEYKHSRDLSSKIELLSQGFAELMLHSEADPIALLREIVVPAPEPVMSLADYAHIQPALALLRPYLRRAIDGRQRGVNVLIYGVPGTGKTQLARVLAKDLGRELFEVTSEDAAGDAVASGVRLRAYRAAQSFFSRRQALVAFDEIEDVFTGEMTFLGVRAPVRHKAWMNRMLEGNPAPAIWMSNSVECLDPAVIRRFDQVIELTIPPRAQRARIIEQSCEGILDARGAAYLSRSEELAPAVVLRAARVVSLVRDEFKGNAGTALTALVNNTLRAQGHKISGPPPADGAGAGFDLDFIHADTDLQEVAVGLRQSRSGRLCLYGPPGTGKTAFAHHLADQLGMTLHAKRASDLLSKWVGDSERNVARAFEAARQDGGLLVIDEADSFLIDRRGAQRSWEVSLTNELLTQLEAFEGIFVASTNLIEGLDHAALRRFDLKARFDFLKADQAWRLLVRECTRLGLPAPDANHMRRVEVMDNLTPGDFAALARRHRFQPLVTPGEWVDGLEVEAALKRGGKNRIGF